MQDRFYYGYRQTIVQNETGQPTHFRAPLKQKDLLNPGEDDHFAHGIEHDEDVTKLYKILQNFYEQNPFVSVFRDLKIIFEKDGLAQPVPDILIIPNVIEPDKIRKHFAIRTEDTEPSSIFEVVSPRFVEIDLETKATLYQQAGIEEYIILDSGRREGQSRPSYRVIGYQLNQGSYQPIQLNGQGHLYSKINKLWLGPNASQTDFMVVDERTGKPLTSERPTTADGLAQLQGAKRASELGSALDFLRTGGDNA